MGIDQRENAFKRLSHIYDANAYSNIALGDKTAFERRLVLGCIERRLTLEYIVSCFARKKPDKELETLLHTGIYQIMYMDVPDSAACDETTDLAKKLFGKSVSGFVNAVLRSVCRSKDELCREINGADDSIKYSLDKSICDMIRREYADHADEMMTSFFDKKRLFARVNTLKSDAAYVADMLEGKVIGDTSVEGLDPSKAVKNIGSGLYFIQGMGSQTAVKMLDARAGMTVADVCACPGGKTLGAAIDMCATGRIYASDIHKSKLSLINKGAAPLGVDACIDISLCDARTARNDLLQKCDRVICDVPCTALGEIISRPEIGYKNINGQSVLYKTQADILDASSKLLTHGGRLVYSTCTLDRRENDDNINRFLSKNGDFELLYSHTFMPHTDGCGEGFYIALIVRR